MTRTYSDAAVVSTLVGVSIVGVVIGVLVGRSVSRAAPGPNPKERTWVTLRQVGQECRPDEVGALAQYQGKRVIWNIVNNCSAAYYLKVDNFRRRDPDNGNVPANTATQVLDNPNEGITTQAIAANGGRAALDAKLARNVADGLYKYVVSISANGQTYTSVLDPDVDPWP
jgi:hypothetical protein